MIYPNPWHKNFAWERRNNRFNLNRLLELVQKDSTLCLEIRENYINIYYRGGNIMKLFEEKGSYSMGFDSNYNSTTSIKDRAIRINKKGITQKDLDNWLDIVPLLKHEMDLYFGNHSKKEREFQQLMVRENNRKGGAKGSDYFIAGIEYAESAGRFDMLAIHWPSTSAQR